MYTVLIGLWNEWNEGNIIIMHGIIMCSFLVRDKNSTHALLMPKVFIFGPKLFLITGIVHNKSVENHDCYELCQNFYFTQYF